MYRNTDKLHKVRVLKRGTERSEPARGQTTAGASEDQEAKYHERAQHEQEPREERLRRGSAREEM